VQAIPLPVVIKDGAEVTTSSAWCPPGGWARCSSAAWRLRRVRRPRLERRRGATWPLTRAISAGPAPWRAPRSYAMRKRVPIVISTWATPSTMKNAVGALSSVKLNRNGDATSTAASA
jgi:hypothetical protein